MQLPPISFGPVQNDVAPALRRVGASARGLSETVQQGLALYGRELVRTQGQEAQLTLTKGLDTLEQELRTRKAIPVEELRTRLGPKFDTLDEKIRNQPLVEVQDPATGKTVRKPADVPTWAVAGELFDHEAESNLGEASSRITVGSGWESEFQAAARADMLSRKTRLNVVQLQAMEQYQVDVRTRQVLEAANAGDFGPPGDDQNLGAAGAMAQGALAVVGADGVEKLRQQVRTIKQTKPVYDALRMVQVPAYREEGLRQLDAALASLGDSTKYSAVPAEKLAGMAHEVRAAAAAVRSLEEERANAIAAFEYAGRARSKVNPLKIDEGAAVDALDADVQGGKVAPERREKIRNLLRQHVADRNDAAKAELDQLAGAAFGQFLGIGADGKPRLSFANVLPGTIAALETFGKDGQDVIAQLVRWEQSNEAHARNMANLPSPDESAKALALEYAIATRGKQVAALGPAGFTAILRGEGSEDLGIPAGPVSARDIPHLSQLFSQEATPEKRVYLVKPDAVAFEEAMEAFPSLKAAVAAKGAEKGPLRVEEDVRKAVRLLTDRLAAYIDANPGPDGRGPAQDEIRAEARRLLQTVEVKDSFLRIPTTARMPRVQAEATGRELTNEGLVVPEGVGGGAPPAPQPAPAHRAPTARPPPPAGTPRGWILYRNAETGELRYNAPGKARGAWQEVP